MPGRPSRLNCSTKWPRPIAPSSRSRLLLWSGFCFIGLTLSNALLFIDLQVLPEVDLYMWRLGTAAAAMLLLVYGLVFESE